MLENRPTSSGQSEVDTQPSRDLDDFYRNHFDYMEADEPTMRELAVQDLAAKCPVTRSDAWGGFWVINKYDLVRELFQDWESFSNTPEKSIHSRVPGKPDRAPVDTDPPLQRNYRQILNPYLTPKRLGVFEPGVRDLCTSLIDGFVEDGQCDLVEQFANPLPAQMFYRFVLDVDPSEVEKVQAWQRLASFEPLNPEAAVAMVSWTEWIEELVERRRKEPRRDTIVDALLIAKIDGEPLPTRTIVGTIMGLIEGGFGTQREAISSVVLRLAEDSELQGRLRDEPAKISEALDEFLRFDPPVPARERLCTRDTTVGGYEIAAGDRVYMNLMAAHRDPDEFPDGNRIDIDRSPNRHFGFGAGVHRCIGSNIARLNMRIALEELLARLGPFRLTEGDAARREAFFGWGPTYLPISFSPGG
jgi:cytochrome P450